MKLDFTDEERALITEYYRKAHGVTGLPKLATRKTIKEFVGNALYEQWLAAQNLVEARQ